MSKTVIPLHLLASHQGDRMGAAERKSKQVALGRVSLPGTQKPLLIERDRGQDPKGGTISWGRAAGRKGPHAWRRAVPSAWPPNLTPGHAGKTSVHRHKERRTVAGQWDKFPLGRSWGAEVPRSQESDSSLIPKALQAGPQHLDGILKRKKEKGKNLELSLNWKMTEKTQKPRLYFLPPGNLRLS